MKDQLATATTPMTARAVHDVLQNTILVKIASIGIHPEDYADLVTEFNRDGPSYILNGFRRAPGEVLPHRPSTFASSLPGPAIYEGGVPEYLSTPTFIPGAPHSGTSMAIFGYPLEIDMRVPRGTLAIQFKDCRVQMVTARPTSWLERLRRYSGELEKRGWRILGEVFESQQKGRDNEVVCWVAALDLSRDASIPFVEEDVGLPTDSVAKYLMGRLTARVIDYMEAER